MEVKFGENEGDLRQNPVGDLAHGNPIEPFLRCSATAGLASSRNTGVESGCLSEPLEIKGWCISMAMGVGESKGWQKRKLLPLVGVGTLKGDGLT